MTRPLALAALFALAGCAAAPPPAGGGPSADGPIAGGPSLREAYAGAFRVGVALNAAQATQDDPRGNPIVEREFNSIVNENLLKWAVVHPERGVYDFALADAFVAYGEAHGMEIIGHALVWHEQIGDWAFEHEDGTPLSRDELLAVMEDHIATVVGRYRGRIHGWDVVNEALAEDGSMRDTKWRQIIGDDYIEHAFRFAHAADPDAELYYNDYGTENADKRAGAIRLLDGLVAAGVRLDGVGIQSHQWMDWPTLEATEAAIEAFAPYGPVMITELDIGVLVDWPDQRSADVSLRGTLTPESDPYADGLPPRMQRALAERYADVFRVFWRHRDTISRVTFWGVTDGDSWRNYWPIRDRSNYPLLFDRDGARKAAYDAVLAVPTE